MRRCLLAFGVLLFAAPLSALPQIIPLGPDSREVRLALVDTWFALPFEDLRIRPAEFRTTSSGDVFLIRVNMEDKSASGEDTIHNRGLFDVEVVPRSQVEMNSTGGAPTVVRDLYRTETPGTWVLRRNVRDGQPRQLRCVLAPNLVLVWTLLPPREATTKKNASLSLRLFDSFVIRDRPSGISFERLSVASQTQLQDWFPDVPWHLAKVNPALYADTLQMIGLIRRNLPRIAIVDDAAYGADDLSYSVISGLPRTPPAPPWKGGEIVGDSSASKAPVTDPPLSNEGPAENPPLSKGSANDPPLSKSPANDPPLSKGGQGGLELSNAGFVKWIADGLVRPIAGNNTLIPPVLRPTGNTSAGTAPLFSTRYNLHFALDWCRNLADAVDAVTNGRRGAQTRSRTDVVIEPLADAGATAFLPDTGYQAKGLRAILYILAAIEPDTFYFAAPRETDSDTVPEVSFYNSAAAIFPFFNASGGFDAVVFESGVEMSLAAFLQKYTDSFIHLSRVVSSAYFFPQ